MHMTTWTFDRSLIAVTLLLVVLGMVLPLVLVATLAAPTGAAVPGHSSELTVGIGVIIRATVRRLIRSGARGVVRTTISTLTRTVARTLTRRVLRVAIRSSVATKSKGMLDSPTGPTDESPTRDTGTFGGLLVGIAALSLSFWGILVAAGPNATATILAAGQLSLPAACVLASLPMLLYAILAYLAARWQRLPIRFVTTIEGLLVQAYFTGAGSFLPMTTDIELEGQPKSKARVAGFALFGLYGMHLLSAGLAHLLENPTLGFASGVMLIYCFVYAFPIKPLEGYWIWSYRKIFWALVFVPILLSFALTFPETLQIIL
jgi:hypothetical protein